MHGRGSHASSSIWEIQIMPDKENEEILYKFIDNAYLEIKDVQREFFKTWNNQIKRHLQVKGNYCIEGNLEDSCYLLFSMKRWIRSFKASLKTGRRRREIKYF